MKNSNQKKPTKEYTPYGPEWEAEMMKWSKAKLEAVFGITARLTKKTQISLIRSQLLNESKNPEKSL